MPWLRTLIMAVAALPVLAATQQAEKTFHATGVAVAETSLDEGSEQLRHVTVAITAPGATRPALVTLREGALGRIESEIDGRSFGIAVRTLDAGVDFVEARFFEIVKYPGGGEGLHVLAAFQLREGVPFEAVQDSLVQSGPAAAAIRTADSGGFTFALIGADLATSHSTTPCGANASGAPMTEPVAALSTDPEAPCTKCCISCNGWRYCGCAVQACGTSCCCPDCC